MEPAAERDHPGLIVAGAINFMVAGPLAFFTWMSTSLPPMDVTSATLPTSEWPMAIGRRVLLASVAGIFVAAAFWFLNRRLARRGGSSAVRAAGWLALASGALIPIGALVGTLQLLSTYAAAN